MSRAEQICKSRARAELVNFLFSIVMPGSEKCEKEIFKTIGWAESGG